MSTTTTTDTGQNTSHRTTPPITTTPATQTERSAANRLRSTMAAVRLAFTWLGTRKTLLPEQRDTAARAFHADRELLSATKLILDTKNPTYRAVAAVRSEASGSFWTVTLPTQRLVSGCCRRTPSASSRALLSATVSGSNWPPVSWPPSTTSSSSRPNAVSGRFFVGRLPRDARRDVRPRSLVPGDRAASLPDRTEPRCLRGGTGPCPRALRGRRRDGRAGVRHGARAPRHIWPSDSRGFRTASRRSSAIPPSRTSRSSSSGSGG